MRAFSFLKIDGLRCKTQIKFALAMMVFFSFFFVYVKSELTFVFGYLSILTVMFATQPFTMEHRYESGFIDMIPGSVRDRVLGRFLYGFCAVAVSTLIELVTIGFYIVRGNELTDLVKIEYIVLNGVILLVVAFEQVILYALGKTKAKQYLFLAQIIPGFVIFIGIDEVVDYLTSHPEFNLSWFIDNKYPLAWSVVAVAAVLYIAAFFACNRIVKKRDFA